ncbi:MAG: glycosyltransferase [Candidatus Pacearchaeota archaeon]
MKILIVKTGALGDVVRCTFLAQALYDKYKKNNPKIYWLTEKNAAVFFKNNNYVDKVFTLEKKEKLKKIFFDIIVNLEEDEELVKFSTFLRHKEFIGFIYKNNLVSYTPSAKEWYDMSLLGEKPMNDILKRKCKKSHRQLMSEIIGVNYRKYEPHLRLSNYQLKLSDKFAKKNNIKPGEVVIGLILGGADRWPKQLPVNLSIKLIDKIYKKFKCKIILFGGPNEKVRNKEILSKIKSPIIDSGTDNSIEDFISIINVCTHVISTDTLGLHIALGLKKKTLCLIGPTPPYEKDMFGLGKRIVAKSKCVGCLKKNCKSMEKISISEIIYELNKLIAKPKLAIIITAFREPKIKRAIDSILNQEINYDYDLILSAPDDETLSVLDSYKKLKNLKKFKDPGKGKNLALNLLLKKLSKEDYDILVLTDGDVYLKNNSINELVKLFENPSIGCVSGRPFPEEDRNSNFGYFANFLFEEAHKMRKRYFENNKFLEASGYLFAFRNKIIDSFPLNTAEDTIIPYYFYEKGYRIGYSDNAIVYVKNVNNWKDWINQKTRTSISHENLDRYVDTKKIPRQKTFMNEAKGAFNLIFVYPKNFHEFFWSLELMFARLYMWMKVFYDKKIKGKEHSDAWQRIESTK